jgi:hypothetical protein
MTSFSTSTTSRRRWSSATLQTRPRRHRVETARLDLSGRSRHWVKSKNPKHPAVKREAEEDWAR